VGVPDGLAQQMLGAVRPVGLDDGVDGVDPFPGLGRIDIGSRALAVPI
jgi:hypothetical protein